MSKVNLIVDKGATYSNTIVLVDDNGDDLVVNTHTANAGFKANPWSNTYTAFTVALANGSLTLSLTANATANLEPGTYFYDVKMTYPSGAKTRLQERHPHSHPFHRRLTRPAFRVLI
jgi:hypothetical protein